MAGALSVPSSTPPPPPPPHPPPQFSLPTPLNALSSAVDSVVFHTVPVALVIIQYCVLLINYSVMDESNTVVHFIRQESGCLVLSGMHQWQCTCLSPGLVNKKSTDPDHIHNYSLLRQGGPSLTDLWVWHVCILEMQSEMEILLGWAGQVNFQQLRQVRAVLWVGTRKSVAKDWFFRCAEVFFSVSLYLLHCT